MSTRREVLGSLRNEFYDTLIWIDEEQGYRETTGFLILLKELSFYIASLMSLSIFIFIM
jgi:hypothetical protein